MTVRAHRRTVRLCAMDTHHDQVMRAREAASAAPSRLYFGYSTILDRVAFDQWRAEHGYAFFDLPEGKLAEALDVGLVFNFPSRFWGGRVAGLTDRSGSVVYGRLYEVNGDDWPIIQHKEGAVTGMSVERTVKVRVDGREVEAVAFVTRPDRATTDGPVSERFIEALVRGARAAGLPEAYLAAIEAAAR